MPDELASWRPTLVVGSAYLLQGLIAAVGALMLGLLAQLGVPLETQVGILASGALPWLVKVGLALVFDLGPSWPLRVRAGVLTGLQLGAALLMLALADQWTSGSAGLPSSLAHVAGWWLVLNALFAVQDTLVDTLALDLLGRRRAWTAAAMGLGHALGAGLVGPWLIAGTIIGAGMGAGLGRVVIWLIALALLPVALLWVRATPTRARDHAPARAPRSWREWAQLLAIPALLVVLMLGPNLTSAVSAEFLFARLGWDYPSYATELLPLGAIAGVLGALAWGPLVARCGAAKAGLIAALGLALAWLSFASAESSWSSRAIVQALAGTEGLLQAGLLVALHGLALRAAARTPLPVTAFVLAMAAINLPRVLGPLLAPSLVERGWVVLFVGCGATQALAALGLLWIALDRRFAGLDVTPPDR